MSGVDFELADVNGCFSSDVESVFTPAVGRKKPGYGHVLILFSLSLLAFWGVNAVSATEFEVEGDAIYDLYDGRNLLNQTRTNAFRVSVRGQEWSIKVWFLATSNRLESTRDENGLLRTIFCQYNSGSTNRNHPWSNSATIERREVPTFESPFLGALWLAYCSPSYLKQTTNGTIETIWTQDNPNLRKEGYRQAAKWVLNDSPPNLPVEVAYLSDGRYHGYDRLAKKPFEMKVRPPYDSGYTNAIFFAHSFTNLPDNSAVPTEIYFRTFQTPLGKKTTPDMPRDTLIGNVRKVSSVSSVKTFVPEYEGEVSIYDFAYLDKLPEGSLPDGNVRYDAKNGAWPGVKEQESLAYQYTRKVSMQKEVAQHRLESKSASHRNIRRTVVLSIAGLTTAALIFVLARNFVRGK